MASSSSSSSSLKPKGSCNVFLSFRGLDVHNNFVNPLYEALNQTGIYTYIGNEEPTKGEEVSLAVIKAIEESSIAIIVFSEGYASTPWCLEEVAKIMECKAQNYLIVLPVFYKVEPSEVRLGRESYGRAMANHESKFGKDSKKVNRWKEALFNAGSVSGRGLHGDGDEAELIKGIVKEVSMYIPLHVAKRPVGIYARVVELESMLNLQPDDVLMLGLWGQGGIGKTTAAKGLYNSIFRQFDGSCFLANVGEVSRDPKGLTSLQEKMLSDLLVGKGLAVTSDDEDKFGLLCKKILLVLDDVDDLQQLRALAGKCTWFGKGSRIIITTRDMHLLSCHGIGQDQIYEVRALGESESLELLIEHAFPRSKKRVMRRGLLYIALNHACGLPLALEVLGSYLCGRRELEWISTLKKLSTVPDKTIYDFLKLSYDALADQIQEIFLDIACFFKGRSTKYIKKVFDSCDLDATIGLRILLERSLIFIERETIQIHDLIRDMGRYIVSKECNYPANRSRLWHCDDVFSVLSSDMGTCAARAIVLHLPNPKEICIRPDAFSNMRKLSVLIMINVHTCFQGPICLPNGLRWFEWPECPRIPEFSSGPKNLVGLDLHKSNIQVVREQFKDFKMLKFINFSECQSLVCMPDLNCTPNLEELDLHGCKNLKRADESLAHHNRLRLLNLSGCSELHDFPDVLQSKNLELLNLNHCSKLERFPDIPDKIKSMRGLYLIGTSIEELPKSIENLVSLEEMDLRYCKKLAILPSSIYMLLNLEKLTLEGCSKLVKFPKMKDSSNSHMKAGFPKLYVLNLRGCNLSEVDFLKNHSCFPFLRALYLLGNNITNLPTCGQLHNLLLLDVSYCQQLQEIHQDPGQLSHLWSIDCESLSKLAPDNCDVEGYPVGEGWP